MPSTCVCGIPYNEDHAMPCQKGRYIHHRHNEIRDLFIKLAEEISNDVECEPQLQPLSGEQLPPSTNITDEARLDLSVRSFWQRGQRAFYDVRVFNPFAPSYQNQRVQNLLIANEKESVLTVIT